VVAQPERLRQRSHRTENYKYRRSSINVRPKLNMAYLKRKRATYKKKATKKPYRKPVKRASFAAKVKRIVLKTSESKRMPVNVTKVECFHNVMLGQTYHCSSSMTFHTCKRP
jgi:hypothetical protein